MTNLAYKTLPSVSIHEYKIARYKRNMPVDQMSILLDNPSLNYFPGQVVSGKVVVRANGGEMAKALQLNFWGMTSVHFTRTHTETHGSGKDARSETVTRHYSGQDSIFTFAKYLLGNGSDTVSIPSGDSQYPFSFELPPNNIPSSYVGACGKVEYSLKAMLLPLQTRKFNPEIQQQIMVTAIVDLNNDPLAIGPGEWSKSKVFCCCCCASGPLEIKVTTNKRGYCPGEIIEVNVAIDNLSSRKVKDLTVDFMQKVSFTAQGLTNDINNSLVNHRRDQGVGKGESDSWRVDVNVFPIPPTRLGGCRIIDVQYSLRVVAKTPCLSKNLEMTCPIIIGNVPVNSV